MILDDDGCRVIWKHRCRFQFRLCHCYLSRRTRKVLEAAFENVLGLKSVLYKKRIKVKVVELDEMLYSIKRLREIEVLEWGMKTFYLETIMISFPCSKWVFVLCTQIWRLLLHHSLIKMFWWCLMLIVTELFGNIVSDTNLDCLNIIFLGELQRS